MPPLAHQFWKACSHGDASRARTILEEHPDLDVNWTDKGRRRTPLHRACSFHHSEVVKFLLLLPQCDPNLADRSGVQPLLAACRARSLEIVRLLLGSNRLHGVDVVHCLLGGMIGGSYSVVQALLEASLVIIQATGAAHFFTLVLYHGNVSVLKHFLASGLLANWATKLHPGRLLEESSFPKPVHGQICNLLGDYGQAPHAVARQLRLELGWATRAARYLALLVFWQDAFLKLPREGSNPEYFVVEA